MTDGVSFDFSEILKLAADLGEVPRKASTKLRKAVEVTARRVKDDWKEPLKGSQYLPRGPYSISYDVAGGEGVRSDAIVAEIGPELSGQGALVGMLEYGTPTIGPTGYGAEALRKNQKDFEKGIELALGDVL